MRIYMEQMRIYTVQPQEMKKQQSMANRAMDSTAQIKVHKTSSTIDKSDHHRIP